MAKPNNPRAFPSGAISEAYGGMTLLDYFAGQALAGWLASSPPDHCHPASAHADSEADDVAIAALSYVMAEAMLARRAKPK